MHFEPIFKEGVITVDNVATVAAYKNAINVLDNIVNKYSDELKQILDDQNIVYCDLLKQLNNLTHKWDRDKVKEGQKYVKDCYDSYFVYTKFNNTSYYFDDPVDVIGRPTRYRHFLLDKEGLKEKISGLLSVASRAIHPFAVTTKQAGFITTCEEMTEEAVIDEIRNSFEKNQKELDECSDKVKEITNILESQLVTKPTETKEDPFVSVFSPKSDSRSVWQWIKDTLKGE